MRGRIVKGVGGLYYVHCGEESPVREGRESAAAGIYECRAKGIFRKENLRPLVGDEVEMDVLDGEKNLGNIVSLLPRHSELIRPAVANVDQAMVIFSIVSPRPNFNLLDRFLIMMARQNVASIICFNKADIDEDGSGEKYRRIYDACGYRTVSVSAKSGQGISKLRDMLSGRVTTAAGPSGVGKSSLINCLQSNIVMETGEISAKIQRGKHTTRHSEMIALGEGTYILDTPGFSSLNLPELEKEELASCYPEFGEYEKYCRFTDCSHIGERLCGVKDAVEQGKVSRLRYGNYCLLYEELEVASAGTGSRKNRSGGKKGR